VQLQGQLPSFVIVGGTHRDWLIALKNEFTEVVAEGVAVQIGGYKDDVRSRRSCAIHRLPYYRRFEIPVGQVKEAMCVSATIMYAVISNASPT